MATVSRTSNLVQGGGANARIQDSDPKGTALPNIDYPHHRIHHGTMYTCYKYGAAVADAASIEVTFILGSDETHIIFEPTVESGPCHLFIYEDPTYTTEPADWGTLQTSYRTNRDVARTGGSGEGSGFAWYNNPTVLTAGTLITRYMLAGGGGGPFSIGDTISDRNEWVFDPNRKYLFRLTNNSGGAIDMLMKAVWYTPRFSV
jgi:hypothetical protein